MKFFLILLGLGIYASSVGCSQSDKEQVSLVEVNGTVTIDGKPFEEVSVIFTEVESGKNSRGTTDQDGKFSLVHGVNQPGAVPGESRVEFLSMNADGNPIPPQFSFGQSKLMVNVSTDNKNDFAFDLSEK